MKSPKSVKSLEALGRVRLSKSFFMRDFLYSEISQIELIPNIPDHPEVAIEAGTNLCEHVLEPIQQELGRISIRSAYRSPAVNGRGSENRNRYNCSSNESSFGHHIWDYPDKNGKLGATACVIVNSFIPYYEKTNHWQALAWWIHENIEGYSSMYFFPKYAAFNIRWCQHAEKVIKSYVTPKGILTKPGMENGKVSHEKDYEAYLREITA